MSTANQVTKLYRTVVDDVTNNVKEAFLDEGVDEQILQELKQLWEAKLAASKALEPPTPPDQDIIITPPNVAVTLPQPLHTKTQSQAIHGQPSHIQAATQFQMSQAAATASMALAPGLFQQQLAALSSNGQLQNITVQQTGNGQYITLSGIPQQQLSQLQQQQLSQLQQQQLQQPQNLASHILQPQQIHLAQQQMRLPQQQQQPKLIPASQLIQGQLTLASQPKPPAGVHHNLIQIDGLADTSSSDDDDFDDDDRDDDDREEENEEEEQGEEEDPLNSDDDVSEEDPSELFDTENVVVCQYDKINRNKNKWKFHLKDGIMNLNGRDFVFQKATGDAEW
ncbi:hypothetical protein BsWGS_15184 [Bradybaena similaris]